MNYYRCPTTDLHRELKRRGYDPSGYQDELAEALQQDDESRSIVATTIATEFVPLKKLPSWKARPEFGRGAPTRLLVNECIVHWTMNTFYPSLHLFFASGRSVHIDGSELSDALIGLDPELRERLTDLTHEEDGRLTNTIFSKKLLPNPSIRILEATIAMRSSIAVKETSCIVSARPMTTITQEAHVVIGLRLQGMKNISYVWARKPVPLVEVSNRMWGHVRISGLRNDIPIPLACFPQSDPKPGAQTTVVQKGSMVAPKFQSRPGPEYINLGEIYQPPGLFDFIDSSP